VTDMTGGYIGIRKVVSEEAREKAEEELRNQMQEKFNQNNRKDQNSFVLIDTDSISYGVLREDVQGDSIVLTLSATADAYQMKREEISNFIGHSTVREATSSDMFTLDIEALRLSLVDNIIEIEGSTEIRWETDIENLKEE